MAVAFDEMNGPGGVLRPAYQELSRWLKETPPDALEYRRQEAELLLPAGSASPSRSMATPKPRSG